MSAPDLVIFGSLTIDNVVRTTGEVLPQSSGGNSVYAALGARVWSDSVGMVSRYGTGYPPVALDLLAGLGIDVGGIRRVDGPHRMNVAFAYRADGSRTRVIPPHVLATMGDTDRARFYDSSTLPDGHLILTDFAPDGDDMPATWWEGVKGIHCPSFPLVRLAHIAATARTRAADPALWIGVDSPWHDNLETHARDASALFRDIDLLLPSEQDLENHRPGEPHDAVAHDILEQGVKALALKRGPNGCRLFVRGRGRLCDIPVVPVDAIDPTGAGDSFCGGFLAGFRLTRDLVMAAHYGVVSASFCVERPDIQGLIAVDRADAIRRLETLSRRTGVTIKLF